MPVSDPIGPNPEAAEISSCSPTDPLGSSGDDTSGTPASQFKPEDLLKIVGYAHQGYAVTLKESAEPSFRGIAATEGSKAEERYEAFEQYRKELTAKDGDLGDEETDKLCDLVMSSMAATIEWAKALASVGVESLELPEETKGNSTTALEVGDSTSSRRTLALPSLLAAPENTPEELMDPPMSTIEHCDGDKRDRHSNLGITSKSNRGDQNMDESPETAEGMSRGIDAADDKSTPRGLDDSVPASSSMEPPPQSRAIPHPSATILVISSKPQGSKKRTTLSRRGSGLFSRIAESLGGTSSGS